MLQKTENSVQSEGLSVQDSSNSAIPEVIRHVVTLTAEYICKKLVSNSTSRSDSSEGWILI